MHSSDSMSGHWPVATPIKYIGDDFYGKIDEVRIWNSVRTQEEIQLFMNDTLNGDEIGLAAYYQMNLNENRAAYRSYLQ